MHFGRVSYGSASGLVHFQGPMGWQWLEEARAVPRVGLLDSSYCSGKAALAVLALLGRDRLMVAVDNDDVHTWLGHAAEKSNENGSQ